ncbi:DUF4351 domain-containing protein [Thermanaeromonas toyohensis]|nr:DUF4351 domain-containing protein [Thermanaeromonas toyohensis]
MELRTSWHIKGWQEGWQKGLQEGLQQGLQQGLEEGRREKAQDLVMRQLKKRLGFLSSEVEERIKSLSLKELDELAEKIFEVTSESDLRKFLGVEH